MTRRPIPALGWSLLLSAVGIVLLMAHARLYMPFISDDALISLRYADRLLDGLGLTWNDGERVEGYSNLLWVLGTATLGRLGIDLIDSARLLGLLGMASVVLAVVYAGRPRTPGDTLRLLPAVLLVGMCGPMAAWAIGGLEQPLVAGLLAWALVLAYPLIDQPQPTRRAMLIPGLLFGLLCLTRPDGPLFVGAASLSLVLLRGINRPTIRLVAWLGALPVVAVLGQLAFRLAYYGEWLPNPALVKLALTAERVRTGLAYVWDGALHLWPVLALAAILVAMRMRQGLPMRRQVFLAVPLAMWVAYVAFVGGDIFPARRHLVPALVVLILIVAESLSELRPLTRRARTGMVGGVLACLVLLVMAQRRDPENYRAAGELWEWQGKAIAVALKAGFGDRRPLMAVSAAGCLPYWSELPSLDMLGLNDHYLPRHPPAGFGHGYIGHELGDGDYVLRRAPDLIFFGGPLGGAKPVFLSDHQLVDNPEFQARYVLARFEGTDPYITRSAIWVRRDSPRVGIRREPDGLHVPAHLFNGHPDSIARLDETGRFALSSSSRVPARLPAMRLAKGTWTLRLVPASTPWRATVRQGGQRHVIDGASSLTLQLTEAPFDLEVAPVSGEATLRAVVFTER